MVEKEKWVLVKHVHGGTRCCVCSATKVPPQQQCHMSECHPRENAKIHVTLYRYYSPTAVFQHHLSSWL